jgi:hypothetical protein
MGYHDTIWVKSLFSGQKAANYVLLLLLMVIILDPIVFIDVVEAFLPVKFFRILVATTCNFYNPKEYAGGTFLECLTLLILPSNSTCIPSSAMIKTSKKGVLRLKQKIKPIGPSSSEVE